MGGKESKHAGNNPNNGTEQTNAKTQSSGPERFTVNPPNTAPDNTAPAAPKPIGQAVPQAIRLPGSPSRSAGPRAAVMRPPSSSVPTQFMHNFVPQAPKPMPKVLEAPPEFQLEEGGMGGVGFKRHPIWSSYCMAEEEITNVSKRPMVEAGWSSSAPAAYNMGQDLAPSTFRPKLETLKSADNLQAMDTTDTTQGAQSALEGDATTNDVISEGDGDVAISQGGGELPSSNPTVRADDAPLVSSAGADRAILPLPGANKANGTSIVEGQILPGGGKDAGSSINSIPVNVQSRGSFVDSRKNSLSNSMRESISNTPGSLTILSVLQDQKKDSPSTSESASKLPPLPSLGNMRSPSEPATAPAENAKDTDWDDDDDVSGQVAGAERAGSEENEDVDFFGEHFEP